MEYNKIKAFYIRFKTIQFDVRRRSIKNFAYVIPAKWLLC